MRGREIAEKARSVRGGRDNDNDNDNNNNNNKKGRMSSALIGTGGEKTEKGQMTLA